MPTMSSACIDGAYLDPETGRQYPYSCRFEIFSDAKSRETLNVRGTWSAEDGERPILALGHVDHRGTFAGREAQAVDLVVSAQIQRALGRRGRGGIGATSGALTR